MTNPKWISITLIFISAYFLRITYKQCRNVMNFLSLRFYVKSIFGILQTCTAQSGIRIIEAINEKSTILIQFGSYFQKLTYS